MRGPVKNVARGLSGVTWVDEAVTKMTMCSHQRLKKKGSL